MRLERWRICAWQVNYQEDGFPSLAGLGAQPNKQADHSGDESEYSNASGSSDQSMTSVEDEEGSKPHQDRKARTAQCYVCMLRHMTVVVSPQ